MEVRKKETQEDWTAPHFHQMGARTSGSGRRYWKDLHVTASRVSVDLPVTRCESNVKSRDVNSGAADRLRYGKVHRLCLAHSGRCAGRAGRIRAHPPKRVRICRHDQLEEPPFASQLTMLIFVYLQKDTVSKYAPLYSSSVRDGTLRICRSPRVPEAFVL
jgi:hypothetical protein